MGELATAAPVEVVHSGVHVLGLPEQWVTPLLS